MSRYVATPSNLCVFAERSRVAQSEMSNCFVEAPSECKTLFAASRLCRTVKSICLQNFGSDTTLRVCSLAFDEHHVMMILGFLDGFVKASPANSRAVLEVVAALRSQGHECIEFAVPERTMFSDTFFIAEILTC